MTTITFKTKEAKERGDVSRAAPSLLLAGEQQYLTYVIALVEATRERRLAALRISELTKQAVDMILHLAERATYSWQE